MQSYYLFGEENDTAQSLRYTNNAQGEGEVNVVCNHEQAKSEYVKYLFERMMHYAFGTFLESFSTTWNYMLHEYLVVEFCEEENID